MPFSLGIIEIAILVVVALVIVGFILPRRD